MSSRDGRALRVAYVLKKYPRISETFILNEILGLEALGVDVSIHSLTAADEGRFHADVARVRATARYSPPLKSQALVDMLVALHGLELDADGLGRLIEFLDLLPREKRHGVAFNAVNLADTFRREGVDHVHAHFMTVAAHCAHAAHLLCGIPYSVTAHAKDIYRTTVDGALFSRIANGASRLLTVSEGNREFIQERFGVDPGRVAKIYNGLPLDDASFVPRDVVRDPDLVLAVGRLVEKKGFDDVVRTCRRLVDAGHDGLRCLIVGEGDARGAIEALIEDLGLADRVTLTGSLPREDVVKLMTQARVLVAPYRVGEDGNRDALPTVLIEALALGLPVVSTALNGVPEIVSHEEQGLIVAPGDVDALTQATGLMLRDGSLWDALSKGGPVRARERFDRDVTLPQILEVFAASRDAARGVAAS